MFYPAVTAVIAKLEKSECFKSGNVSSKFKDPSSLRMKDKDCKVFEVDVSSKFFSAPSTLTMPSARKLKSQQKVDNGDVDVSAVQKTPSGKLRTLCS